MEDKNLLQEELTKLEAAMASGDFWSNKEKAQSVLRRIKELQAEIAGVGKYDSGNAVMTIFSGAGGDDAEDFSAILLNMYLKYFSKNNFSVSLLHENKNDHGGYRNVTIEISGKGAYGTLKNESGVHRLVRISPFNAKSLRHTSFSMVEVIPKFEKIGKDELDIKDTDIRVELSRSSGPGGQNVNKRETAVRVVHIPTNLSAQSDNERSQAQNKEKAMQILYGKIYKALEEERISKEKGMYISKTTQIEWGNQIRSYVMHPYKMVKDHRTNFETSNIDAVLDGGLDEFLEAEKDL
ncbi:MAG: Peptide chain release factor 2 [Parcubacteria group bacterium Gr01-1014_46]|nr:MAG: Peptide chain release factor 2 [Parcubacteria group bacterium Gr01-1014_46]